MDSVVTKQKADNLMITQADLQCIADFFELGEIEYYSKSKFGRLNSTYFITIRDSSEYVIRVLRDANTVVLENEYAIQKWLEEEGVTTNTMLISKEGGYLYSHGSEHATVSKKLEGRHPEPPVTEGDCYLVGSILSRFHLALKSHSLPHPEVEGFLGRKGIEARINRLPATDYVTKVKELLIESNFEYDELPMGIVHGDPYFNNILINDDDVCVLDLQKVSESPLILDIGRSIADICSHMGELDRNKVKKFIKGYENRRTLTSLENHLLSKAIMYGAVATSVSLYEQHSEYTIASILLKIAYAAKDFDI